MGEKNSHSYKYYMELTKRQKCIAQILVCCAKNKCTISYKELGDNPKVQLFHRQVGKEIGEVSKKCGELGLPPISAIVINAATGKPGAGFTAAISAANISAVQAEVYEEKDWSKLVQHINEENEATMYELNFVDEGTPLQKTIKIRKRNQTLRNKVLKMSLGICEICNFDAKKIYGAQFENKIHIHHKKPLSLYNGEETSVKDLIAVCPNCHMILHSKGDGEVYSPNEVKAFISENL